MSKSQSEIHEASSKGFDAEGASKEVMMPADPLADAKVWLAAMQASMQRAAQQAQQPQKPPTIGFMGVKTSA